MLKVSTDIESILPKLKKGSFLKIIPEELVTEFENIVSEKDIMRVIFNILFEIGVDKNESVKITEISKVSIKKYYEDKTFKNFHSIVVEKFFRNFNEIIKLLPYKLEEKEEKNKQEMLNEFFSLIGIDNLNDNIEELQKLQKTPSLSDIDIVKVVFNKFKDGNKIKEEIIKVLEKNSQNTNNVIYLFGKIFSDLAFILYSLYVVTFYRLVKNQIKKQSENKSIDNLLYFIMAYEYSDCDYHIKSPYQTLPYIVNDFKNLKNVRELFKFIGYNNVYLKSLEESIVSYLKENEVLSKISSIIENIPNMSSCGKEVVPIFKNFLYDLDIQSQKEYIDKISKLIENKNYDNLIILKKRLLPLIEFVNSLGELVENFNVRYYVDFEKMREGGL